MLKRYTDLGGLNLFFMIGTSKAALDVFTGVATEYFLNVGRTLRFLCDKYSQRMSAEVNSTSTQRYFTIG